MQQAKEGGGRMEERGARSEGEWRRESSDYGGVGCEGQSGVRGWRWVMKTVTLLSTAAMMMLLLKTVRVIMLVVMLVCDVMTNDGVDESTSTKRRQRWW